MFIFCLHSLSLSFLFLYFLEGGGRGQSSNLLPPSPYLDSVDDETYSPLHMASKQGHTAIIVALVEEGGADVNVRGGEQGDTPLMLTVRNTACSVHVQYKFLHNYA